MDESLVVFTEARAVDLRLTYSRYLAPRRLLGRVLDVEHRAQEIIDKQNGRPACFGTEFAGYQNPSCSVCQLQAACLVRTTADALPAFEDAHGADARALAQAMSVPLQAIDLMHALRSALLEEPGEDYTGEAQLKHGQGRRPVADVSAWRNPPPKRRASIMAFAALFGAQAAESAWPPAPRSITQRLHHGLQASYVIHALAWMPQKLTYGSPTWKRRIARDRKRMPELAWVPDGTVLRVVRNKEQIDVRIFADRIEWRGQMFPTLYEVCAAVCGRIEYRQTPAQLHKSGGTRFMPKTSARRFFAPALMQISAMAKAMRPDAVKTKPAPKRRKKKET